MGVTVLIDGTDNLNEAVSSVCSNDVGLRAHIKVVTRPILVPGNS